MSSPLSFLFSANKQQTLPNFCVFPLSAPSLSRELPLSWSLPKPLIPLRIPHRSHYFEPPITSLTEISNTHLRFPLKNLWFRLFFRFPHQTLLLKLLFSLVLGGFLVEFYKTYLWFHIFGVDSKFNSLGSSVFWEILLGVFFSNNGYLEKEQEW